MSAGLGVHGDETIDTRLEGPEGPRRLPRGPAPMIVGRVRRTLRERDLLRGGEGVLVACSGGADSISSGASIF